MIWYKEIKNEKEEHDPIEDDVLDFSISTIQTNSTSVFTDLSKDVLLQWIMCPFLKGEEGLCFQIPIYTSEIYDYVLTYVAPHFHSVKGIYRSDKITMIRLSELNVETQHFFQQQVVDSHSISPIVHDFYMKEELNLQKTGIIDCKNVEIIIDVFRKHNKVSNKETNKSLWSFLKNTHILNEGNIVMAPQNWLFSEQLLYSPTLEYLSRFAERIILTVNKTNQQVRAIEIM